MQIYLKNKQAIERHNADQSKTWKMGSTRFSDLSQEEFIYTHLTLQAPDMKVSEEKPEEDLVVESTSKNLQGDANIAPSSTPIVKATVAVNWTALGKMTPVKDQGNCGSCYAFSAVGAIEAANYIQKGVNVSLSEQQIVDCSGIEGNYGCNGGWPSNSFVYVINNNLTTTASYPYTGRVGTCKKGGNYRISSYKSPYGCSALIAEVANRPLTVEVDASYWYLYSSGVFNSCSTTSVTVNHAVLLAGVDSNANWWIKNSWGKYWGQNGYILLAAGNSCGICKYPGYSPYI